MRGAERRCAAAAAGGIDILVTNAGFGGSRSLMSEPDSEAYAASKGGIVALTHALAASLARRTSSARASSSPTRTANLSP